MYSTEPKNARAVSSADENNSRRIREVLAEGERAFKPSVGYL
jgi:hypothetical protein